MTALIIPAYKPCRQMLELVGKVVESSEFQPIVVDDGSGEEFSPIFEGLPEGVVLLRHPQNRGKGAALKTALEYILQNLPECDLAVTADADGQHSFEDIVRVTPEPRRSGPGEPRVPGKSSLPKPVGQRPYAPGVPCGVRAARAGYADGPARL